MARITVEDCVLRVPSRFELVMLAAQRARFVAKARGESAQELERLDRGFADLNARRRANLADLRALGVAQ